MTFLPNSYSTKNQNFPKYATTCEWESGLGNGCAISTACFFSTETKDDVVFQSPDQTETCTMIFLKGLGLAFMFSSVEIFPI